MTAVNSTDDSSGANIKRGKYRRRSMSIPHPDGERVALVPAAQIHTSKQVTFRFNFFDELHRIAPIGSR